MEKSNQNSDVLTIKKGEKKEKQFDYESNVISINGGEQYIDSDLLQMSVYSVDNKFIEIGVGGNASSIILNKEQAIKLATLIIEKSREIK